MAIKTPGSVWNDAAWRNLIKVVGDCSSVTEAAGILGFSRANSLTKLFRRRRLDISDYLGKGGYLSGKPIRPVQPDSRKPTDPVERYERVERESQLKREHRDLVERLREAEKRQGVLDRLALPPSSPKILRRERSGRLREGAAVILASDWHVEERVYPEAVAGRNEYNLTIADERAKEFFRRSLAMIEFSREAWTIRDVILWLGGDLLTGYIHAELEESNELSPVEALIWLRQRLIDGISSLLSDKRIERLVIPCSYGNHGRTTQKRRIKTGARNSFEWLLYQWLAAHYEKEPRVTFDASPVAHQYVEAYDKTLHFTHGDELKYGGGVGGLAIPLGKRVPKWENVRQSAYHFIGHFHEFLDLGHTIINGSLIGYSDYAMSIGASFEPPRQAFCVIDSVKGKCLTAPLWVEPETQAEAA